VCSLDLLLALAVASAAQAPAWVAQGSAPSTGGQVEGLKDREVAGAVNAVAPHPKNADILYIGAVNGGIWKTENATAATPVWKQLTDGQKSLSVGALEFDPTDNSQQTLVAGLGRFSSLSSEGGARAGLLSTADGGDKWTAVAIRTLGGRTLAVNVRGIAPRGSTIVVAANEADQAVDVGIWRTKDGGRSWAQISGGNDTGLPTGAVSALASDPSDPKVLFANAGAGINAGLYRSADTGATWARVSNNAMNARIAAAANLKIAVGPNQTVYVAVVDWSTGQLSEVFRSADGGKNWSSMGVPTTAEGGIHPGRQGGVHLSLAADPNDANFVYVGGDRQDGDFREDTAQSTPNSIGARDYSGRLFRGDASKPAGMQWVHLTHSSRLGAAGGGTKSGTSPHADSRTMRAAANGDLIEGDDGGVFRRTQPRTNAGDWASLNGNLQVTEFHAVAWDANAKAVIGGAQDVGTPEQPKSAATRWQNFSNGDGGVVAVDAVSSKGFSTRYTSYYGLNTFRRSVYDAKGQLQSSVFVGLQVDGGGQLTPQFYTPIRLNAVDPTRLVIGANDAVYESFDQGDTLTALAPNIRANGNGPNPIAYGAKGQGNADALYVGSGDHLYIRRKAGDPLAPTGYQGGQVLGVVMAPDNPTTAFVVSPQGVFRTQDAGQKWDDLTGNLSAAEPGWLRSIAYCSDQPAGLLVIGADRGVFAASGPGFNNWSRLGVNLPPAPVYTLEYAPGDRLLLAGTLGRGAWALGFGQAAGGAAAPAPAATKPSPEAPSKPAEAAMKVFLLRPGALVDRGRQLLYIMAPNGGIEALKLANGEVAWATKDGAKPVAVVGDVLVTQAAPTAGANALKMVILSCENGKVVTTGSMGLPEGVRPSIQSTPHRTFSVAAAPVAGGREAVVSWQVIERPKRALPPGTKDVLPGPGGGAAAPPAAAGVPATHGVFKVNLADGTTAPHEGPAPQAFAPLPPAPRIPDVPGPQLRSADGRHVLARDPAGAPKRDAEGPPGLPWRSMVVFDQATKGLVGKFPTQLQPLSFFVDGPRIVFETAPFARGPRGSDEEPAKVRAVDLETGKEVWSRPVREDVDRNAAVPP
jgi:photosystem II stability/assembly factor-like uncharacterized protein